MTVSRTVGVSVGVAVRLIRRAGVSAGECMCAPDRAAESRDDRVDV